jgi:DNA-binding transcriptional ArsR family regulator
MVNGEYDMGEASCDAVSEVIGVLSNPYRIRILCALAGGERSVCEIASAVGIPPAHASAHLRVLYDRGHVSRRREWKRVFYDLRDTRVRELLELAAGLAGESLPIASGDREASKGRG